MGDPAKIRLVHGGIKETHVFHLHNHQWRLEPENPVSTIIDSITISPQECYTLDILYGAGSRNGVIGDVIFHCHLYPHFHEGMWTLWRIHDRFEDGNGKLPDGTTVPALMPLRDRKYPPLKDELHPGYPVFMNGKVGGMPLQPPCGVLDSEGTPTVCPTLLETANFVEHAALGALYTDTCPCHTAEEKSRCKICSEKNHGMRNQQVRNVLRRMAQKINTPSMIVQKMVQTMKLDTNRMTENVRSVRNTAQTEKMDVKDVTFLVTVIKSKYLRLLSFRQKLPITNMDGIFRRPCDFPDYDARRQTAKCIPGCARTSVERAAERSLFQRNSITGRYQCREPF